MDLKQSLGVNGEYDALYGEVVTYDMYLLNNVADIVSCNDPNYVHWKGHEGINFKPDVVFDLGANVGIFSRYVRELWSDALIVAVEPNPNNCKVFKEHTPPSRVILIEKAIGKGVIHHGIGSANGAMEVYLSNGLGYNDSAFKKLKDSGTFEPTSIESVMLKDLKQYISGKTILKLDIEGNETVIFNDPESMEILKTIDYICMELHYFAYSGAEQQAVIDITDKALAELTETHDTRKDGIYFYARKR